MTTPKTLYLIDGSAYIYRAYHAIRSLSNSKGLPTNAVYGFTRMLLKLMEDRRPEFVALCFDAKGPTFRHDLYPDYKANRPPMPEDLVVQLPYIKEVVTGFNLAMLEKTGYEADDLIGTLALQARKAGFAVVMVTGDKDFLQLVADKTTIWDPMKEKTVDVAAVRDEYGVAPQQMIDVMGLSGDTSDNVPGVPGIGPKTAKELIRNFGSLENLYDRIDTLPKNKQQTKLAANREQAFLSRRLVTIDTGVPITFDPQHFKTGTPDNAALSQLFNALEFRQLQQAFPSPSDLSGKRYHCIRDTDALAAVLARVTDSGFLALDTETTSENP